MWAWDFAPTILKVRSQVRKHRKHPVPRLENTDNTQFPSSKPPSSQARSIRVGNGFERSHRYTVARNNFDRSNWPLMPMSGSTLVLIIVTLIILILIIIVILTVVIILMLCRLLAVRWLAVPLAVPQPSRNPLEPRIGCKQG